MAARRARAVAAAAANKFAPLYLPSAELLAAVASFYGLGPGFPWHRLLLRSMQGLTLVLVAEEVLDFLRRDSGGAVRLISTGVRLFDRDTAKGVGCPHRVCQNGLPLLLPHMTKQRATLPAATMRQLLLMPEGLPTSGWRDGGEGAAQLQRCGVGSVALECDDVPDGRPLALAVLYAPSGTLRPMIGKAERSALLSRLGRAPTTPQS